MVVPVGSKVWLELGGDFMIGDGGLQLLQRIREHGSLAATIRRIGLSYRHGWGYLRCAARVLGTAHTSARCESSSITKGARPTHWSLN
jgi:molybdenum-dependent DNA-binding transcriptional regulator ModE